MAWFRSDFMDRETGGGGGGGAGRPNTRPLPATEVINRRVRPTKRLLANIDASVPAVAGVFT